MRKSSVTTKVCCLLAGFAFIGTAIPAAAQSDDEAIVVTGRYGPRIEDAPSVSQSVSYADLDLGTEAGRHIFHHRLRLTARYLCDKLGESDVGPGSCRDAAYRDSLSRVGTLEAHFAPRGSAWVASHAWAAPYPEDWQKTYPE